MEECCVLTYSLWLAQPSCTTQGHLPTYSSAVGTTYSGLGPPTTIQLLIKKMPTGQSDGGVFSTEVYFSQMMVAGVKLTKD